MGLCYFQPRRQIIMVISFDLCFKFELQLDLLIINLIRKSLFFLLRSLDFLMPTHTQKIIIPWFLRVAKWNSSLIVDYGAICHLNRRKSKRLRFSRKSICHRSVFESYRLSVVKRLKFDPLNHQKPVMTRILEISPRSEIFESEWDETSWNREVVNYQVRSNGYFDG